jgi:hypothetical protein
MRSQSSLIERFSKGAESGSASHMFIEGDVLYSYGHHFPLAIRQDWGARISYLLNGDRYSPSTSSHQRQCLTHVKPNVQIPFSALQAANLCDYRLPRRDLRIVASRSDEYHCTCKHCGREVEYGDGGNADPKRWAHYHVADGTPLCSEAEEETVSHHVLGAVVFEHQRRFYLSSIDDQEGWRVRAYFLCWLPEPVSTVEEAFEVLVPEQVRKARQAGVEVRRQGDIFAVATPLSTRQIRVPTQRCFRLFDSAHVAAEARVNGAVYIRGTLRHQPDDRRPQHSVLRLGRTWWMAVKNLALASWNAVGSVD